MLTMTAPSLPVVYGGAMYYTCDPPDYGCDIDMFDKNTFTSNYAENSGGAIKWDQVEPNFEDDTTVYTNNGATLYGDNIASFAQMIIKINETQYLEQLSRIGLGSSSSSSRRMLEDASSSSSNDTNSSSSVTS